MTKIFKLMPLLAAYATASFAEGSDEAALCTVSDTDNSSGLADLIITEIQSANIDQFLDPSRNYGGWVELYNAGQSTFTLTGCWVSDDASNLEKVHLTGSMTVEPGAYVNLWFDHHDALSTQVDMKLDAEGGTIFLSDPDGNLVVSQAYPEAVSRCSYARKSLSGNDWAWTSTPTPEASNEGSTFCTERLEAPTVDKDSQTFGTTLTVCVNIPEGTTLRYTTDGSTPTATNGETSTDGLFYLTSETTVYRFCLIRDGYLPSQVITRTYIYKDKDFPLPVVSVASDSLNLYSDDYGIFVYDNRTKDWDRPVNFEYFDADGQVVVNQEAGIERTGGATRIYEPYAFKVNANKQYELQNYLPYDFFSEKPYLKHKTLVMRSGGNDPKCRIKDAALQEIVMRSGIDIDCQAYQPAMHYINGKYAGTINVREPSNKKYVYANYGLDDDEIDLLEMLYYFRQKCGTYDCMQRWLDLAVDCKDDSVYEQIRQIVDIDEYCNYMAVELFLCNSDWPHNNLKVWRPITSGGKFRHILYDIDHALTSTTPFTNLAEVSLHYNSPSNVCEAVRLFFDMLGNESFRKQFIDTFCLVAGSVFEPTRCKEIITELCDRVEASQLLDTEVYTGTNVTPWTTGNTLISTLTTSYQTMMIDTLAGYPPMGLSDVTAQSVELSSNIDEARLLVNDLEVPTGYFNGKLFPPVTFKAEAPAGYKFLGWKLVDGTTDSYVSTNEEYEMPSSGSMVLQACYTEMSGKEKAEQRISTAPVVINEVSAGNSVNVNEYFKKDDWVELYNMTDEDIDLEGMYITDTSKKPQKFQITAKGTKASTIIPAHGFKIIWCSQRETNTELHTSFKLANADGELVRIEAENGTWADSLVYCAMNGDGSVGRYPDGGSDVYLMTSPTIRRSNRMNSYTTLWDWTDPSGVEEQSLASRSGGMSIAYVGDCLLLKDEDCDTVSLGVHTVSGITVILTDVTLEGGHTRVSIASLPSGVYVASSRDEEGNQCATKFVKK